MTFRYVQSNEAGDGTSVFSQMRRNSKAVRLFYFRFLKIVSITLVLIYIGRTLYSSTGDMKAISLIFIITPVKMNKSLKHLTYIKVLHFTLNPVE